MHEGSIKIRIQPDLKEIERLNRLVRQFGELHEIPSRTLYSLNLALDEMVTNAVLHGHEGAGEEPVEILVAVEGRELVATMTDGGKAFNPLDAAPPDVNAPLSERQLGGLGIHLVRSLMDRVEYRRDAGKNVLTLTTRIR